MSQDQKSKKNEVQSEEATTSKPQFSLGFELGARFNQQAARPGTPILNRILATFNGSQKTLLKDPFLSLKAALQNVLLRQVGTKVRQLNPPDRVCVPSPAHINMNT